MAGLKESPIQSFKIRDDDRGREGGEVGRKEEEKERTGGRELLYTGQNGRQQNTQG